MSVCLQLNNINEQLLHIDKNGHLLNVSDDKQKSNIHNSLLHKSTFLKCAQTRAASKKPNYTKGLNFEHKFLQVTRF